MRRLSRLPLRIRLTLGFAGAAAILLAAAGTFIFFDVKSGLDGSLDANLASRADYLSGFASRGDEAGLRRALDADNEPAQLLAADGHVIAASPSGAATTLLPASRRATAVRRETAFEHDERTRLLARPVAGDRIVIVATSMLQRERALELLSAILLIGSPLILLLASGAGYWIATAALRPVEQMRRRAAEISTATTDALLPLPAADDELRRLGVTLNEMLERLAASAAGERAFLSSASHELRTPLAILKAEVDLALTGPQDIDELRAALRSTGEEADRLIRLADDLLVVARGQEGRLPLSLTEVRVGEVLDGLVAAYAVLGADRLSAEVDEPGLVVRADRLRLEQALGNLVDNALRHGGSPVRLRASAIEGAVEIHVADSGAGFSEDALGIPLDGTPRASATGFGLGLAMVASIARAHGGSASAANTAAGADTWVTLPRAAIIPR